MVDNLSEDNLSDVTQRSLVRYCFLNLVNHYSVLVSAGETVYSCVSVEPEKIFPISSGVGQQYIIKDIDGISFLFVGSNVTLMNKVYSIYIMRDISFVYEDSSHMAYRFMGISAVCIAAAIFVLMTLIRFTMKPLKKLNSNVKTIASGIYDKRVSIRDNDEVGAIGAEL